MNAIFVARDGARLAGVDEGQGPAVVFQHGLTGDAAQVAPMIPRGVLRRLTLECRAHGGSESGDPAAFSFATFADDVMAFLGSRGVERFVVGGVSMGAALALRIAVKWPSRVRALILSRPAWLWDEAPDNMRPFAEIAPFVAAGDRRGFEASETARRLAVEAPDNLNSLRKIFDRPDRLVVSRLIGAIALDGPGVAEAEVRALRAPTLTIGGGLDHVHPIGYARKLAETIRGARFIEVSPKALDADRHAREIAAAIGDFLRQETIIP